MNIQSVLIFIGIVLGAVGAIGVANVYVAKPVMTPELPVVAPLPAEGTQGQPTVDNNIVAASLERIQAVPKKEQETPAVAQAYEPRKVARNSFLWPGEEAGMVDAKGIAIEEEEEPSILRLVFIGTKKKVAVINDEFLSEGDMFRGEVVHKIEKNAVLLRTSTGEITRLTMVEMTYAHLAEELQKEKEKKEAAKAQATKLGPSAEGGAAQQEAVERLMERLMPLMTPAGGTTK